MLYTGWIIGLGFSLVLAGVWIFNLKALIKDQEESLTVLHEVERVIEKRLLAKQWRDRFYTGD